MPREQPPVGNPLFLSWVEQLRDDAREKGMRSAETFHKACKSLAACPVAYERPRDLVCLQGIGPKIVGILEQRYKTYCEDNGLPVPSASLLKSADGKTPAPSPASDDGAAPAKKRKTKPKVYIPQKGSGGYGILIGLVTSLERPELDTRSFLTKSEVIRAAQPYSDSGYEHSEKGNYFTAWNSMKTLINRGYVYVTGNPQNDVAATLRNIHPDFVDFHELPLLHDADGTDTRSLTPLLTRAVSRPPSPPESASPPGPSRLPAEKFQFWYIDSAGSRVPELTSAAVRLDPDDFATLRKIEFRAAQRRHPYVSQLRLVDGDARLRDASGKATVFAFIPADEAPPRCSTFDDKALAKAQHSHLPTPIDEDEDDIWVRTPLRPFPKQVESLKPFSRTTSVPVKTTPDTGAISRSCSAAGNFSLHSGAKRQAPRLSGPGDSIDSVSSTAMFYTSDAIVFPAGSFEIVLIIDTREVESRSNRDKIAETMRARGIKVETRALRMGDMCWLARLLDGAGGEEDECVLDYVVERKRLDDLCISIRDGRYTEQCFRLASSCISHVYYVVEDFQVAERKEFHGSQIATAKSQLQVINGFYLKETHKLSDTIDFLASVTDVLIANHASTDLYIIPTRCLSRASYADMQRKLRADEPKKRYLITFGAYQEVNDKTGSRTLRERLARMLLCVKGMSPERVGAVLDRYDTPLALWEAMKERAARGDEVGPGKKKARGPDMFFADAFDGEEGRRKFGDALSRDLWKALMGDDSA
ncbi:Crossover junction endonuclease mus81 [Cryptotrichosporon argae]